LVVETLAWRSIAWIVFSGTPKRYRLVPKPRRAACQPCHSGRTLSRSNSWSGDPFAPLPRGLRHSGLGFPQTPQRLSAGRIERFKRFPRSIGWPFRFGNITPEVGFPLLARWDSRRIASGIITGIAPWLLRVLG